MKRVVSVSLGSPKGDFKSQATYLGEEFELQRIGTNGDMKRYAELIRELDGNVDAITLGGIDRYYFAGGKRYVVRDAEKLARNAKKTPVVDGSGIKNTLERKMIEYIQENNIVDFSTKNVLLVAGVDRFGLAEVFSRVAKNVVYGDLLYAVGVPFPMRSYSSLKIVASLFLPLVCTLPFQWFYPTGEKQEKNTPKYGQYFSWADIIAGDNKIISRYMPTPESGAMKGKTVITNTLTPKEIENLKERGVETIISPTFEYNGRITGTNVLEGVLITLAGKRPEEMTMQDYEDLIAKLEWKPTIRHLSNRG
jgi:hypothetical protein